MNTEINESNELALKERINAWTTEKTLVLFNQSRLAFYAQNNGDNSARPLVDSFGWVKPKELISIYEWSDDSRTGDNYFNSDHYACAAVASPETRAENIVEDEFAGSFSPSNTNPYVELSHVSCSCGAYTDRNIRISGTIGDLIYALMNA